jgi:hypothetical protein
VVLAGDETDLLLFPPLRAAWSLRGQPLRVVLCGRNARRVVFGTMNLRTGRRLLLPRARQRAADFRAFLGVIHYYYRGWHVALLVDEDPCHTAKASVQLAVRLGIDKNDPLKPDAAFNFFVTAEHMLDWVYPKRHNQAKRKAEKQRSVLLQICSHLANGAKHFEVEDPQHKSVESTETAGGYFPPSFYPPGFFPNAHFGAGRTLVVRLKGAAAAQFGPTVGAPDLAEQVMAYWDKHPQVE